MQDPRWQELTERECRSLLAGAHLGRIAVVESGRPLIFPVNYVLDGTDVVFRTDSGSKLYAAALGEQVAFEVDGINPADRTGWSVLIRGAAEYVTDPGRLNKLRSLPLVPWAPGAKPHYVRINSGQVSGRRISVADLPSTWWG